MDVLKQDIEMFNQVSRRGKAKLISAGVALALLGGFTIVTSYVSTLLTVFALGWVLLFASLFQFFFSFTTGRWSGFLLHLLLSALYGIGGLYLLINPLAGAVSVTAFIAFMFLISGVFRITASLTLRFRGWGWAMFSGVLTTGLGVYTIYYLPQISTVLLGTLIGADMLILGVYLITFGAAIKADHGHEIREGNRLNV